MNGADWVVIAILVTSMYTGWRKGMLITLIEFFKWIASIVIARIFYQPFTDALRLYVWDPLPQITGYVRTYLYSILGYKEGISQSLTLSQMTEAVQKLNFPEALTTVVMTAIGDKAIGTTVDFVNEIAGHMAEMIVYGLGFLILILLLLIAFGILALVAKVVSKLPLIKELNHGGGLLIGAAVGLISVYFVLAMLTFFQTFAFAREAVSLVEQSTFAIYFYNHNLLQYVFNAVLIEGTLKL